MARGWESKSVEAQQEEAARGRTHARPLTDAERSNADRRRSLELARARAADDLTRATVPAHRKMLEQVLAAIEAQLQQITSS
jgi:hypothetical protein